MTEQNEHLWQAYLDGELSTSEAAAFEASLSDGEREQLAEEMRFERVLAERLSESVSCPDPVWDRTKKLLQESDRPVSARGARRWYWGAATLAAAASVAFAISLFTPGVTVQDTPSVILAASTIEELEAQSMVEPGTEAAQQFLEDQGCHLKLDIKDAENAMGAHHRPIVILGARQDNLHGNPVVEVLMGCCGRPVKVLVVKRECAAAREIGVAAGEQTQVQATRSVGEYFTAVVGEHSAHGLLDVFTSDGQ